MMGEVVVGWISLLVLKPRVVVVVRRTEGGRWKVEGRRSGFEGFTTKTPKKHGCKLYLGGMQRL